MPDRKLNRTLRVVVLTALAAAGILGAAIGTGDALAQANSDKLKAVLIQMDAGAQKFHSAEADIKKEHLEKIVNDTSSESGRILFQRNGTAVQVGARFDPPDAKTLEYKDGKGRLYTAGTNHIDAFSTTGPNQARFETYVTLGFGGSGTDLAKAWTITYQGREQMSDGSKSVPVEKLDLVSKEASVRTNYSHVTIWIDPVRDVALKQEFFAPSGNTDSATYTRIKLNQPADGKAYAIKCKGKCS